VDNRLPWLSAATMGVNLFSAYRMLHDFVKPPSPTSVAATQQRLTVIQNGANSGVGRAVIQLARALKTVDTINVIRERPSVEQTKQLVDELHRLGATHVFTDRQLQTAGTRQWLHDYNQTSNRPIRLALNCVGGRSAVDLCRQLVYVYVY
jgi:trans-2-enoyl-CoA reductase